MLRAYDLSVMQDKLNEELNNPRFRLLSLKISCSEETGYTVATVRFSVQAEDASKQHKRYIKRFVLFDGMLHPEVDLILRDKNCKLLKYHVFPTKEGTVVVLDYQKKKGRS